MVGVEESLNYCVSLSGSVPYAIIGVALLLLGLVLPHGRVGNVTMTVGAIAIGVGFLRSVELWILRRGRIPVRDRPVSVYPTRPPTAPLSADAHGPTVPGSTTQSPLAE